MNHVMLSVNICKWLCNWKDDCFYVCIYVTLGFMFRHEFLKEMILTFYACIYMYLMQMMNYDCTKGAVSINYLLRVVLDFNSVVFMFYFNWMRVTGYCILLIINLLILGATSPKGSGWEMCLELETIIIILIGTAFKVLEEGGLR